MATTQVTQVVTPSTLPQQLLRAPVVDDKGLVTWVWTKFFQSLPFSIKVQQLVKGTHSVKTALPASQYADGSLFYETDRKLWYAAVGNSWNYLTGYLQVPQSALPTDLGASDTGLLAYVTDFAHVLMWTGTGWVWGPGDPGSDMVLAFVTGPDPITGWQACDGSANVSRLNFDGSVDFVNVPNTPGSFYRQ